MKRIPREGGREREEEKSETLSLPTHGRRSGIQRESRPPFFQYDGPSAYGARPASDFGLSLSLSFFGSELIYMASLLSSFQRTTREKDV